MSKRVKIEIHGGWLRWWFVENDLARLSHYWNGRNVKDNQHGHYRK